MRALVPISCAVTATLALGACRHEFPAGSLDRQVDGPGDGALTDHAVDLDRIGLDRPRHDRSPEGVAPRDSQAPGERTSGPPVALEGDSASVNLSGGAKWTHIVSTANYLVVEVAIAGDVAVSGVTVNGNAISLLRSDPATTTKVGLRTEIWGLHVTSGSHTIVVTLDTQVAAAYASSAWTNVNTTVQTGASSVSQPSVTLAKPADAGDVLRGVVISDVGVPMGPHTWTLKLPPSGALAGNAPPTAGLASLTWTQTTPCKWAASGVLLKAK